MIFSLRTFSETSQTFWAVDDTDTGGELGVIIDNDPIVTGDTLGASEDYTGLVTATGLSTGSHTYQMTLAGSNVSGATGTFTLYASGESFRILFLGDTNQSVDDCFSEINTRETNVAAVFGTELYYTDGVVKNSDYPNFAGLATSFPTETTDLGNDAREQFRVFYTTETERTVMMAQWAMLSHAGNHDILAFDNRDIDTVSYVAGVGAFNEYPHNGMPVITGDFDTGALYYNQIVGDVEVIVDDGISYTTNISQGFLQGDTSGSLQGDNKQVAWIIDKIDSSIANVIILVCTTTPARTDDWLDIQDHIDANHPNLTVFFVVPDVHHAFVQVDNTNASLSTAIPLFGKSPSSGVTSSKLFFKPDADRFPLNDGFDRASALTVQAEAVDTSIFVEDNSLYRVLRRIQFGKSGSRVRVISAKVGNNEIQLTAVVGGDPVPVGTTIPFIDWPDKIDIEAEDQDGIRLLSYVRVSRFPSGGVLSKLAHTQVQIVNSLTGDIRYDSYILDGERTLRSSETTMTASNFLVAHLPLLVDDSFIVGTGPATVVRPLPAKFTDQNDVLQDATLNVGRFNGSMRYMEGAITNFFEDNDDPNEWNFKTNVTIGTGVTGPDGVTASTRITFDAGEDNRIGDFLANEFSVEETATAFCIFVKAPIATTARIRFADNDADEFQDITITTEWVEVFGVYIFTGTASFNTIVYNNASGDALPFDIFLGQLQQLPFCTTQVETTGSTPTTRAAETLTLPPANLPDPTDDYSFAIDVLPYKSDFAQTVWDVTGETTRSLEINANGEPVFTHGSSVITGTALVQDEVTRLIVTKDSTTTKLYQNTIETGDDIPDSVGGTATAINIGNGTAPFYGFEANARTYSIGLSQDQVINEFADDELPILSISQPISQSITQLITQSIAQPISD